MSQIQVPGHTFSRRLDRVLPFAVSAKGVWIYDEKGNAILDASGGPLVVNVGHGRTETAAAMEKQAQTFAYVHPTMFASAPVEELSNRLAGHAPEQIGRFYYHSSGSEAVEAAVKMARQVHLANGDKDRFRLISRWNSYHGLTMGALSASGKPFFRAPFAPMLAETIHVPPPYCYRCSFGLSYPGCGIRCADYLEEVIYLAGAGTISAFLGETVSGATIAGAVPPPEYWPKVREILDRNGILLILDEVLCGLGRTGRWFAFEHFNVLPDFVTMGKGLAGGYAAISAVGVKNEHYEAMRRKEGFIHGGTFSHHPVAAAAAESVIRIMEKENLVERSETMGRYLNQKLNEALKDHPHVGDIRGMGCLCGVELVQDKASKTCFDRSRKVLERVWDKMFENHVAAYTAKGFFRGNGDALVLGPPYIITEKEVDRLVEVCAMAVDRVTTSP